ncbi:MAG: hypothetical protein J6U96_03810 [Elusimicrobiaceae bacterium]|nr:hypothetical protein [Elusimicrobiaceae bacterium]
MRFVTALLNLVLLICPCALCYGQLGFSSVSGERGYAAMRGGFVWDLDNDLTLVPSGGYYRISDKEEDETGATGKAALEIQYELNDDLKLIAGGFYIPRRMGFEAMGYYAGAKYNLCYRCGIFKDAYLRLQAGQNFYDLTAYADGTPYPGHFRTPATQAGAEVGSEVGKFFFQAHYNKVIKYNHKPPENIVSNWTEIPFMTAIVQGFVSDVSAVRLSYRTQWITPYAVYARYKYLARNHDTISVAGGLALHWGKSTISGGVEVFEQNQQENRKTYFSMAASTTF